MIKKGALALAECRPDYTVDCTLMLFNKRSKKDFIVRSTLDSIGVWKAKHGINISPFSDRVGAITKDAAVIENEIWIFGIDATKADDIFCAVKIGMKFYKANAKDIISDVYVKSLNTEFEENGMGNQALISANRKLYSGVCTAILNAAKLLGVDGIINFWVLSSNINHKIPKQELHQALRDGGANSVESDDENILLSFTGPNNGDGGFKFKQNLHLASLKI